MDRSRAIRHLVLLSCWYPWAPGGRDVQRDGVSIVLGGGVHLANREQQLGADGVIPCLGNIPAANRTLGHTTL